MDTIIGSCVTASADTTLDPLRVKDTPTELTYQVGLHFWAVLLQQRQPALMTAALKTQFVSRLGEVHAVEEKHWRVLLEERSASKGVSPLHRKGMRCVLDLRCGQACKFLTGLATAMALHLMLFPRLSARANWRGSSIVLIQYTGHSKQPLRPRFCEPV